MIHKIAPLANKRLIGVMLIALLLLGAGLLAWRLVGSTTDDADAGQDITSIGLYLYHPALGPDEHPSVWLDDHPLVVRATIRAIGDSAWTSDSGEFEGIPTSADSAPAIIFTELVLDVSEYIKGSGANELRVVARGGIVGNVWMDWLIPLEQGDQAVLFLSDPHPRFGGPIVNNAYVFDGDIAHSEYDRKTLAVDDLLTGLRDAVPAKPSD